jgi:hypothetical protein
MTHVLRRYARATEVVTLQHFPHDHGMKYLVRIDGGQHHDTEIHCPTEPSAARLFEQIIAYRMRYDNHPFLQAV